MIQDGLPRIDPTQMDGIARELLTLAPDGHDAQPVERVSEADRMLVIRLESKIAALQAEAQGLQFFVTGHLSAVYTLQPGDQIGDNGTIKRATEPAENPA